MIFKVGEFEIDTTQFQITLNQKSIAVEPKVFDLLVYLIEHRERLVTRDELFQHIWKGREVSDTTLSNHIKSARKTLNDDGDRQQCIKTFRGRGYQFIAKVNTEQDDPADIQTSKSHEARHCVTRTSTLKISTARYKWLYVIPLIFLSCIGLWALLTSQPSQPSRPYILVVPFEISATDKEAWQPFAEQITREVIRELRKISALNVIPSSSAFVFKQNKTHHFIQEKLPNVRYIVSATIDLDGYSNIRVSAELEDLHTNKLIWSGEFTARVDDTSFFAIQGNIASALSESLEVFVQNRERVQLGKLPTANLAAYELFVAGQQQRDLLTHESLLNAVELFSQAIALDPRFEAAHIAKADSYRIIMAYFDKPVEVLPKVIEAVSEVLKIYPNSAEARSSLGLAYVLAWRWDDAWSMLSQARELDNSLVLTELGFALYFAAMGNVDAVHEALKQARALDPLNVELADWGHWALAMVGEFDAAIDWARIQINLHPDVGMIRSGASVSASLAGQHSYAIKLAEKGVELDPLAAYPLLALAQAYGHAGKRDKIIPLLEQAEALNQYQCPYETAITYLLLNNVSEAFEQMNRAVSYRSNCLIFMRNDPRLAAVVGDPRYNALLTRIGLDDESINRLKKRR